MFIKSVSHKSIIYFSGVDSSVNDNNSEIISRSSELSPIGIDQNQVGTHFL